MTLRLDASTGAAVAAKHESASSTIDGSADSIPSGVDAGTASTQVAEIMSAVAATAGGLAVVNVGVAQQVRDVTDSIGLTEDEIADQFRSMNAGLS